MLNIPSEFSFSSAYDLHKTAPDILLKAFFTLPRLFAHAQVLTGAQEAAGLIFSLDQFVTFPAQRLEPSMNAFLLLGVQLPQALVHFSR